MDNASKKYNSCKSNYLREWDDIRQRVKKGLKNLGHDIVFTMKEKGENDEG